MSVQRGNNEERPRWLDRPENVTLIWRAVIVACLLSVAAEFTVHLHPAFDFEAMPGFYGLYGFGGCVLLVLSATQLRKLVRRDEGYYDSPVQRDDQADEGGES